MKKCLLGMICLAILFVFGCSTEKVSETGDAVTVHYTGKLEDGSVFDSSEGKDPIIVNLGEGRVIPGFENGLTGVKEGEKKTITIPPSEGYQVRPEMIGNIPREFIPDSVALIVGEFFQVSNPNGQIMNAKVLEVTDDSVKVDMNLPLAGQTLIFEIEVVEISKAIN